MKRITCYEDLNGKIHLTEEECRIADEYISFNLNLKELLDKSDKKFADIQVDLHKEFILENAHSLFNILKDYLGKDRNEVRWNLITDSIEVELFKLMLIAVIDNDDKVKITKGYFTGRCWKDSSDTVIENNVVAVSELVIIRE